jgi:hypothetical protein
LYHNLSFSEKIPTIGLCHQHVRCCFWLVMKLYCHDCCQKFEWRFWSWLL